MPRHLARTKAVRERIESIARLAADAFAKHKITVRLAQGNFRNWQCARPDHDFYLFNVSTEPGRLIVTGDIGCLVVERDTDMVAWARKAVPDLDYFVGKVHSAIPVTEFDPEVALEWIDLCVLESSDPELEEEEADWLREELEKGEHAFCAALEDSDWVDHADPPSFRNYTTNFLWCYEAVRWLVGRLPE